MSAAYRQAERLVHFKRCLGRPALVSPGWFTGVLQQVEPPYCLVPLYLCRKSFRVEPAGSPTTSWAIARGCSILGSAQQIGPPPQGIACQHFF
ncbi:hypothetical protein EVAR_90871_1 [Eumeta japonica]|uniref:Uncharacterized protein n=1 Tax=Eumeta variegata TaxID=151549 RepID=A0A4C2A8P4_EUMVA|nr:hypothetical protein EVAR_90871_1 [Eumeta japonica]